MVFRTDEVEVAVDGTLEVFVGGGVDLEGRGEEGSLWVRP